MLLTRAAFAALRSAVREDLVLSAYLSPVAGSQAEQNGRDLIITRAIAAIRERAEVAGNEQSVELERAIAHLRVALRQHAGDRGDCGWVAFVTKDGVRFSGAMPTPVATQLYWQRGVRATPFVRASLLRDEGRSGPGQ